MFRSQRFQKWPLGLPNLLDGEGWLGCVLGTIGKPEWLLFSAPEPLPTHLLTLVTSSPVSCDLYSSSLSRDPRLQGIGPQSRRVVGWVGMHKKKADAELGPRNLLGRSAHLAKGTEPSGAEKCIGKSCLWAEWLWEPRGTTRSCTHVHPPSSRMGGGAPLDFTHS